MIYVVSDLHGCYEEYCELLEKIRFSKKDVLYVLGDAVDRGPEPLKVIQDMMKRSNVYLMLGNHDYLMLMVMSRLVKEISEENLNNGTLDEEFIMSCSDWMADGGDVTLRQFKQLTRPEIEDILDYVRDALIYEELDVNGKTYVLTHAGIKDCQEDKDLDEYHFTDFLFHRMDYEKPCFSDPDVYLVSGHTPTCLIRSDEQFLVYEKNQHIAIDCGCVYGGRLAAYCLDDGTVTYVDSRKR